MIATHTPVDELAVYKNEAAEELKAILRYWMQHTVDEAAGGFVGRIDGNNTSHATAPKGVVLNSRILWTFSAAYNHLKDETYLKTAARAFDYIIHHFIDKEWGGVYWSVDYGGKPLDTKKQIYALAFAIYGLSEYAIATGSEEAKQHAVQLYHSIEKWSHDKERGGYIEALTRDWKERPDLRLSTKDANERKSMNTHLHVLEAYANLYRIWPHEDLKKNIIEVIRLFLDHIIDGEMHHLVLFFDDDWQQRSQTISYGHDIEAAWLLQEAAEIIGDVDLITQVKERSVKVAEAAARGLDSDGGIWYEREGSHLIKEKHWWPQAEAMVGFFNAWQLTGNDNFFKTSYEAWQFIKQHILDTTCGEWFWGIKEDNSVMTAEDKVGIWKCPYHNGRACLEIVKRIEQNFLI